MRKMSVSHQECPRKKEKTGLLGTWVVTFTAVEGISSENEGKS
jgi:hypothetical protein